MLLFFFLGILLVVTAIFIRPSWLFGILSLVSFAVFFEVWQNGWSDYLFFVAGIFVLVLELFTPTAGLLGFAGLILAGFGLYQSMLTLEYFLTLMVLALIFAGFLIYVYLKGGKEPVMAGSLVLNLSLNQKSGYSSHDDLSNLIGARGRVLNDLRPVGRVDFSGDFRQAISQEDLIRAGEWVRVVKVSGAQIYVRKEVEDGY